MRPSLVSLLAVTVLPLAMASTAHAVELKGGTVTPQLPTRDLTIKTLTKEECEGLGGKVVETTQCSSGERCITVDQHGVIRHACVTKK
jgi:hypothetical protein